MRFIALLFAFCSYVPIGFCQTENSQGVQYHYFQEQDTVLLEAQIKSMEKLIPQNADSAIKGLRLILHHSQIHKQHFSAGAASLYLGNAYLQKSDYTPALHAYELALHYLALSKRGSRSLPAVWSNMGNVYQQMNDYENALTYFYKAIFTADTMQPAVPVDYIYHNLAGLLTELNQPNEKIFGYLKMAEKYGKERHNYNILTKNYINKGYVYFNTAQWDSALGNFNMAVQMAVTHHRPEDEYVALMNIGFLYTELSKFDLAIEYFQKAMAIKADIAPFFKNRLYKGLGVAYRKTGQFSLAAHYLTLALKGSEDTHQPGIALHVHHDLATLYEQTNNYKLAYAHQVRYNNLKDSVEKKEIINRVNGLESKYSVAKKNEEIALKELQIQTQANRLKDKNLFIILAVACLSIFIIFYFISNKQRKKLHNKSMENMQQHQKIELLQAHINGEEKERNRIARELHDGLGGLSSALSLNVHLLKEENFPLEDSKVYATVEQILESLHSEIKKTAHNLTPDILVQHSLPESVLLSSQQMAEAAKIELVVQSIGSFEDRSFELKLAIYRIIQELVNNIIKHAKATKVLIQLADQPDATIITVEDNGIGYNVSDTYKGMGLKNIKTRVAALKGHLNIESNPGEGTTTIIEFYN